VFSDRASVRPLSGWSVGWRPGLEFVYVSGQAAAAGAEEGGVLGAVGGQRRDTEGAGEPVVAASDWLSPGATPAQEARCPGVGSDSCWRRFSR
jgi:hypothetical protein